MTIEEAIEQLKLNKPSAYTELREAIDMAIEVLERQIPKEPEGLRHFRSFNSYAGFCPICRCGANSEFKYCGDCGQHINWSEVEK